MVDSKTMAGNTKDQPEASHSASKKGCAQNKQTKTMTVEVCQRDTEINLQNPQYRS